MFLLLVELEFCLSGFSWLLSNLLLNQLNSGQYDSVDFLQIDGDYSSVQIALFQVSWMLRESVFGKMLSNINSPLLPHKMFHLPPHHNKTAVLTEKIKSCKVSDEANGSLPSKARQIEVKINQFLFVPFVIILLYGGR